MKAQVFPEGHTVTLIFQLLHPLVPHPDVLLASQTHLCLCPSVTLLVLDHFSYEVFAHWILPT